MLVRIQETIARHRMFEPGQKVGVAVSGGADSVFLLNTLVQLAPRLGVSLSVLHLDHGLRGDESCGDAAFVADLAAPLGLPFHLETADLAHTSGNLEETAREARLAFYRRFLKTGALNRVALGHTRNDQAETVLFRFLRGTGTAGLSGIRPVTSEGLVRPLLEIERWEVEAWLRERGIAWREDSTNSSRDFARNRIRHDVLPRMASEWNPALIGTLAQMADWAREEEIYWQTEIDRLDALHIKPGPTGTKARAVVLPTAPLLALPVAAARRLVRRALERVKGDLRSIGFSHVSEILEMAQTDEGHGRTQAPGVDVMRSFEWLRFAVPGSEPARDFCLPLAVPGSCELPSGAAILTEVVETQGETETSDSIYNGGMAVLDWTRLSGSLEVRNWRPGDQYQPAGHSGQQKIKSLFQEARVPLWERRHWPVVTDGPTIVWSAGFGPSESYTAGRSRTILKLRHIPPSDESWNRDATRGRL